MLCLVLYLSISYLQYNVNSTNQIGQVSCKIEKMKGPIKKENRGNPIGSHLNVSYEECTRRCNDYEPCQSFTYSTPKKNCWMMDKQINENETVLNENKKFFTAYKICVIRKL